MVECYCGSFWVLNVDKGIKAQIRINTFKVLKKVIKNFQNFFLEILYFVDFGIKVFKWSFINDVQL